ncbi:MAG: PASTA domain-containing protein [Nitrospirae bacterium]|nr:MAG: PASTA domain-containing protein [Nitrospirota bacterium]
MKEDTERNKLLRTILQVALYFGVFSVALLISSYLTFRFISAGEDVTVPDLRGKTLIEANKLVAERKLYLKIETETYSVDVPEGHIITQNIPPGTKIKEGRTLRVIVSKGPKRASMPLFVGLDIDEAREQASKKGIKIRRILRVHSIQAPEDVVIAQRPTEDEPGEDWVVLLVSSGPFGRTFVCPDFTRMTLEEAKRIADRLGLVLELEGFGSTIDRQNPAPGYLVKAGETITLKLKHTEERDFLWF